MRALSLGCLVLVAPIAAPTTKYRTSPVGYLTKLDVAYSFIL